MTIILQWRTDLDPGICLGLLIFLPHPSPPSTPNPITTHAHSLSTSEAWRIRRGAGKLAGGCSCRPVVADVSLDIWLLLPPGEEQ